MKRRSFSQILKSNPKWNYLTGGGRGRAEEDDDCGSCDNGSPSMELKMKDNMTEMERREKLIQAFFKNKHAADDASRELDLEDEAQAQWEEGEKLKQDVHLSLTDFLTSVNLNPDKIHAVDAKGATFLHHAARAGRKDLLHFLVDRGLDIDKQDAEGNTPLHYAVEGGQGIAIDALLEMGAKANILNKLKMAPLHLACDTNCVEAVQVLCSQPGSEVNIRGEFGQTPIHYCAMKDNLEAATKLIEFSPLLCMSDNNGVYPIHCAATHASRRVLDILLTEAGKLGYTQDHLLNQKSREGCTPLHAAVDGGSEAAVALCIKYGSNTKAQEDNKCTPLHLACGQGALRIVEIMLSGYKTDNTLAMRDIEMMTPLHKAAMFDHVDVVKYLIDQGADMDDKDIEGRTPLLLAASKRGWRSVQALLHAGADRYVTDADNRNLLHVVILHGGNIRDLRITAELNDGTYTELLNERDVHGSTPMHYATKRGNIACVENLIALGATVNLKNKDKKSPLHFAAKYGRLNSIKRLLDSKIGPNIINDTDGEGMTALHIAAHHGHQKVVQLLLLRGALLHKDYKGRTPFHLAAMAGYRDTMDILLSTHTHLLDQKDDCGNSAILLATMQGQPSIVTYLMDHMACLQVTNCAGDGIMDIVFDTHNKDVAVAIVLHPRWDELLVCTINKRNPIGRLIQHMPDVFMKVLDKCQTVSDEEPGHADFWRKYDFKYLQVPVHHRRCMVKQGIPLRPLVSLNEMVTYNRVELLSHPVSIKFLDMKWKAYGALLHTAYITLYIVFLTILTIFVASADPMPQNSLNSTKWDDDPHMNKSKLTGFQHFSVIFVTIFAATNIFKELTQIYQQHWRYFLDFTNYLEWGLYLSCLLFLAPFITMEDAPSSHEQWIFGSFSIFLAWFNLLLYQQKLGNIGIYVVMFLHILKTLIRVMFVFMILVVAFGLSFYILMKQESNNAFEEPHLAIIRVLTMMMGELDYINSFVGPIYDNHPYTQHYSPISLSFLLILCVLLPILLMNLLIGLAVGDIAAVQRDAQLKRLAMQVDQYTDLEHKLPMSFIERVDKDSVVIYPNKKFGWIRKNCMSLVTSLTYEEEDSGFERTGDGEFNPRQMKNEVWKVKRKLKDMSSMMEKQYDLLRLVVQKMEIRSEADERDEGTSVELVGARPRSGRLNLSQVVRLANINVKQQQTGAIQSHNRLRPDSGGNSRPGSTGRRSPASVASSHNSPNKIMIPAEPSV